MPGKESGLLFLFEFFLHFNKDRFLGYHEKSAVPGALKEDNASDETNSPTCSGFLHFRSKAYIETRLRTCVRHGPLCKKASTCSPHKKKEESPPSFFITYKFIFYASSSLRIPISSSTASTRVCPVVLSIIEEYTCGINFSTFC